MQHTINLDGRTVVETQSALATLCSVADCSHRAICLYDGALYCGTHGYVVRVAHMTANSDSPVRACRNGDHPATCPATGPRCVSEPTWEAVQ